MARLYEPRYKKLRDNLLRYRLESKLTQIRLSEILGVSQSYVSKVESGERYLDVMEFVDWYIACNKNPTDAINEI